MTIGRLTNLISWNNCYGWMNEIKGGCKDKLMDILFHMIEVMLEGRQMDRLWRWMELFSWWMDSIYGWMDGCEFTDGI